jgi:hypothetical protein
MLLQKISVDALAWICEEGSSAKERAMQSLIDSLLKDRHFIDGELSQNDNAMERLMIQRELLLYKRRLISEAIQRLEEAEYETTGL